MTINKLRETKQILSTLAVVAAETGHSDLAERFWEAHEALHRAVGLLEEMAGLRSREALRM